MMTSSGFPLTEVDGITVIKVVGNLDIRGSYELRQNIKESIADGKRKFLLDLSGVSHIDSSGIGTLTDVSSSPIRDYELKVANLSPEVEQTLKACRVISLLHF